MKSVIPFTKELDFSTKVSEITSISLEREFEVENSSVVGNLFVTGDYKSHEVSANVIPFSFKIPFTIELPEHLNKESITLEISDFAYDMEENNKIKVNIELELAGEEAIEEENEEDPPLEVNPDELLRMMEEKEEPKEEIPESVAREASIKESEEMIIENMKPEEDEYATYHIHIAKTGETVETICSLYQSNINLLGEYNNLGEVTPGDKIIIPKDYES